MDEKPLVSIIIVNYNGERFLNECLSSVFRTKYPKFEVVFVDNASTDRSLDLVNKGFATNKNFNIVRNSKNLGFGPANNVGFRHTRGDYIVFLNNDTSVDPEWLEILVDAMEKDRTIGLAQSLILNMDNRTVQTAGWLISDYCVFLYPVGLGREGYGDVFPDVFEISTAMGTAMIAEREFLQEVGLFDPRYFWYYDDDYLSFRTWLAGKRVVTVSGSKVCHVGGGTSRRAHNVATRRRHTTIGAVSLILDFYRNLSYMTKGLFISTVHELYRSFREIIEQRRAFEFWGNLSAISWILRNFRYVWGNRLKYWSKARIDERTLISRIVRIRIPTSIYLVPKLLTLYFRNETEKYEKSLSSMHQQE